MAKVIAEIMYNRSMIMHSNIVGVTCDINFNYSQPFNESITKIIQDKTAVVALDTVVKMNKWEDAG